MMECEDTQAWKDLAEKKEKEWKQLTQRRTEWLESAYKQKEKDLLMEVKRCRTLKEDFKYNLKLLQDRDSELERYDTLLTNMRAEVNKKNAEISEVKMQLDEMRTQLKQEQKGRNDLQIHYHQRLKEKQSEVDSFRSRKEVEFSEERKEFENFKRNLEQKLAKLDVEMDVQKLELTAGFDEAIKKQEKEFRSKEDELNSKILEYDLKAKILAKELDYVKSNQKKVEDNYSEAEVSSRLLEKKIKKKEWELADVKAMKDAKIEDLKSELQELESCTKKRIESYEHKLADMDKCLRERDEAVSRLKTTNHEKELSLNNAVRDLQSKLETAEIQIRQLQWANQDLVKEKEIQNKNLSEEITSLQDKWNKNLADMSASQVSKDLEMQCLRENDSKLKSEILQLNHEIEKLQKDLCEVSEREAVLIRSKTQLELDWQNRFEATKISQYGHSENLMEKVALAESVHSEELKELRQQNNNLKEVISQMKEQMEQIGYTHNKPTNNLNGNHDYTYSLEEQVLQLKQQIRKIQDSGIKDGSSTISLRLKSEIPKAPDFTDDVVLKDYILSLTNQIHKLEGEKLESNAQLRNLESRLDNIEWMSVSNRKITPPSVIKQLKGEMTKVEKGNGSSTLPLDLEERSLPTKLQKAVKHIAQLAKEKQQLIEVGNRLRGELKKAGITSVAQTSNLYIVPTDSSDQTLSNALSDTQKTPLTEETINKLNRLEKLQYQLTKQELQFAQNFSPPKVIDSVQSSDMYVGRPSILKKSTSQQDVNNSDKTCSYIDPVLSSVQSTGGESLKEVWRMLDEGGSPLPSVQTPRFTSDQVNKSERSLPAKELSVQGKKARLKSEEERPHSRQSTVLQINKLKPVKKTQVRNYNIKTDK